jgi:hypothetical protein
LAAADQHGAFLCDQPLPSIALWSVVAAMGASTELSYAMIANRALAGRANVALNVLYIGEAVAVQVGIDVVVGLSPRDVQGRYPRDAYELAFLILVVPRSAASALLWFLGPSWWAWRSGLQRRLPAHLTLAM